MSKKFEKGKMVPVPSHAIIPERDIDKSPILECSHLGIDFGGLRAVNDFNLTIGRTEIAGLIGPNGAGKTTIFNLLTKVYQPTRGTILLDGLDTSGKTTAQINRMGIARTFQNIRLFNNLSVEDNVKIGLHNQERYSAITGVLRLPWYWSREKAAHERALELLSLFGMADLADHQAGSLPYGAQRRLEIVRALATNPKLLIADEPTTALDVTIQAQILDLIREMNEELHSSVLFITHDLGVVSELCDTVIVMYTGHIVEQAPAGELFRDPKHPYTIGLLNAIPVITKDRKPLSTIEGMVPNPTERIKGCSFWPRCPHATERCRTVSPPMKQLSEERKVRCWLFEDQAAGKEA